MDPHCTSPRGSLSKPTRVAIIVLFWRHACELVPRDGSTQGQLLWNIHYCWPQIFHREPARPGVFHLVSVRLVLFCQRLIANLICHFGCHFQWRFATPKNLRVESRDPKILETSPLVVLFLPVPTKGSIAQNWKMFGFSVQKHDWVIKNLCSDWFIPCSQFPGERVPQWSKLHVFGNNKSIFDPFIRSQAQVQSSMLCRDSFGCSAAWPYEQNINCFN